MKWSLIQLFDCKVSRVGGKHYNDLKSLDLA